MVNKGQPVQTSYPVNFVVLGGGLSGLACALALARVGHHVVVLEKDVEIPESGPGGGCRLTPNMTKVLLNWNLKSELEARGMKMKSVVFNKCEEGQSLGKHTYQDEILQETGGGEWFFVSHTDLRGILYTAAKTAGADIRTGCDVTAIDPMSRQVTLANGEIVTADIIVGADGPEGHGRETVAGHPDTSTPAGITMYNATLPAKAVPEVDEIRGGPAETEVVQNAVYVWYGDGYCLYDYPMNPQGDHALHVYGPDDGQDGSWHDKPTVSLANLLGDVEPKLANFVQSASPAVRLRIRNYEELEDWIHEDSERMLIIGEAAHPFPQIPNFLWGFQDIRQDRCKMAQEREVHRARLFTLKNGPEQEERDKVLRVLNNDEDADLGLYSLEEPRVLFAYDCEEQGEEWWQSWGLLRERSHQTRTKDGEVKVAMHVEVKAAHSS
ncbi:hypothetical protein EW026_g1053 [Hermanssonia centrifuga]|uniref:FAD-binding domain-containing protein n=1 Tax=Hermanssonia centrifuga TaxID=98765 RepID=A0A4S4KSR0_9APHY|nr:hypothetical protein EW026_g1053 [Hermanssonia centrifuga]